MVMCVSLLHAPQVVVYTRPYRKDAETRRGSADGVTTPREEPPGDGGRDRGRRSVRVRRARTAGSRNPEEVQSGFPHPFLRSSALPTVLHCEALGNCHN